MTFAETTLHVPTLKSICDMETVNRKVTVNIFQNSFLKIFLTHQRNMIHFMLKSDIRYWRHLEYPLEKVRSLSLITTVNYTQIGYFCN